MRAEKTPGGVLGAGSGRQGREGKQVGWSVSHRVGECLGTQEEECV